MDENQELHDQQRSTVLKSGIRSGAWGWLSTGLLVGAYFAATAASGGAGLAVAGALGLGAAFAGYKAFSTNVDQSVQFEDINAQRSADYTAKAIVRELKNEGLVMTQAPGRADGRQWADYLAERDSGIDQGRLH